MELGKSLLATNHQKPQKIGCTVWFGAKWYVPPLLHHLHVQIHSMMSKITHDCYISNQHSEPDLKGAEGNLRCNTLNPIRPACTRECGEEGGPLMRHCWTLTQRGEMC